MHYYQFNVGDYRRDTTHLTPLEHYIYRTLIDWYFLDENPIPKETEAITRRLNLREEHTKSLQNVLNDFFVESADGWVHGRIDKDIENYHKRKRQATDAGRASGIARKTKAIERSLNGRCDSVEPTNNHKPITINQKDKQQGVHQGEAPSLPAVVNQSRNPPCPYGKIVELYHERLTPLLPSVGKLTDIRKRYIRNLWNDPDTGLPDMQNWENFFDYVADSPFLTGKTDANNGHRPFRANLEWLTKPANFVKISEEHYHG